MFGAGVDATTTSVVMQGGKIVDGGTVDGNFAFARSNGTPDTALAVGRIVVTDFGWTNALDALASSPMGGCCPQGRTVPTLRWPATEPARCLRPPATSTLSTSASTSTSSTRSLHHLPGAGAGPVDLRFLAQARFSVSIIDQLRADFRCA